MKKVLLWLILSFVIWIVAQVSSIAAVPSQKVEVTKPPAPSIHSWYDPEKDEDPAIDWAWEN